MSDHRVNPDAWKPEHDPPYCYGCGQLLGHADGCPALAEFRVAIGAWEPEHDRIVREAQKPGLIQPGLAEHTWATPLLWIAIVIFAWSLAIAAGWGLWLILQATHDLLT